jgi:hypothetical protein
MIRRKSRAFPADLFFPKVFVAGAAEAGTAGTSPPPPKQGFWLNHAV